MKRLNVSQILMLHEDIAAQFGGSAELRDRGLLESAANAPFQTFGGADLYPSLPEKAAQLGYGLIKNHPFADGNKRIGAHAMLVFLALNGVELQYADAELVHMILSVAAGEADADALRTWLEAHTEL